MRDEPQTCPRCAHHPCLPTQAVEEQPPDTTAIFYHCPQCTPGTFVVEFELTDEERAFRRRLAERLGEDR
jgi:ribosomal protein S27AE